ncbi:MAG: GNAT family N-acetyltransferase [Clostridia bacterium]|nr:GNAT family N-acetyltransferase [Clostridia bacterium]
MNIKTERLIISPLRETDKEAYFRNISHDRKVLETFICRYAETPEDFDFSVYLANQSLYAIRLKETGRLIGIMVTCDETETSCEIGYGIGSDYWGHGYATEAVAAFIDWCFAERGFKTVCASFFTGNEASRHVMEKCGMAFDRFSEKELTYLGIERDLTYYSISREAWKGRKTKMDRPVTTLYMLMSVDGKISTGASDELDVDRDFPMINGLKEGLHQYYEIEQTTDLWSFNTGRVQEKMGVNRKELPAKSPVSFAILDNHHLTEQGVRYFCAWAKTFVLITSNRSHPAFDVQEENLHIIIQEKTDLPGALMQLKKDFGCERLTVQSGGTVNGLFLREKLFDYVDLVVAPVLIGGKDTSSLIDGPSLMSREELSGLGILKLESCSVLENSYIRLRYQVIS